LTLFSQKEQFGDELSSNKDEFDTIAVVANVVIASFFDISLQKETLKH
jgi:hypothetical protein